MVNRYSLYVAVCVFIYPMMCFADATVKLNNYDSQMPIYYLQSGNLAGQTIDGYTVYVQVMASYVGGIWTPVEIAGTTTSIFELKEPGYFDAGVGVIPGGKTDAFYTFYVHTWVGTTTPDTSGIQAYSAHWDQAVGTWDPNSGLPANGPRLEMPNSIVLNPAPEPSTLVLSVFGSIGLMLIAKSKNKSINI